jgi:hypothetical protein
MRHYQISLTTVCAVVRSCTYVVIQPVIKASTSPTRIIATKTIATAAATNISAAATSGHCTTTSPIVIGIVDLRNRFSIGHATLKSRHQTNTREYQSVLYYVQCISTTCQAICY